MTTESLPDQHCALAAMIAEALRLADELRLHAVGIALDTALERLTGEGIAPAWAGPLLADPPQRSVA